MKILCVLSEFAYGRRERGQNYDYTHFLPAFQRLGHDVSFFDSGDRSLYPDFAELNRALVERVVEFRPDVVFLVLMHYEIWSETLDLIRNNSPAIVINWGTDDSWKFNQASRFFSRYVDFHITTDADAKHRAEGMGIANVIQSQWAASADELAPPGSSSECQYDVTFVGSMYGYRASMIEAVRAAGYSVECFGFGTANGVVDARDIPGIHRASRISLNFSGAGQRGSVFSKAQDRQIKARVFEVPGAGGFLMTEDAPGIDRYLTPDVDIAAFSSATDLIAKIGFFLRNPDRRDAIAQAGYDRVRAEHTYDARFSAILKTLPSPRQKPWTLAARQLDGAIASYRAGSICRWLRPLLCKPLSLVFGKVRGPRAARRFLFELSWRIVGGATYGARGLPGRLFYRES